MNSYRLLHSPLHIIVTNSRGVNGNGVCTVIIESKSGILWRNGSTVWQNFNVKDRDCATLIKTCENSALGCAQAKAFIEGGAYYCSLLTKTD